MHGVRLTVIADDTKRLIWAKQTIRTTERLNDAFVVDNLIEIQRIHPFRVEPSEHLVYDNEQIKLLAAVRCYTTIRTLVRQSRRNILLHRRPCRNDEFFAERLVVIGDDFGQRILFVCRSFVVVDIGIEQRRHMQLGCLLLEQVIIIDSFRNGTGREQRMEFARMAEHWELFKNVRDHHTRVRRVDTILVSSKEILDATDAVPGTINHRTHGDLRLMVTMYGSNPSTLWSRMPSAMLYRCKQRPNTMAVVEFFFWFSSRMGVPVKPKNSAFGKERRMSCNMSPNVERWHSSTIKTIRRAAN